MQRRLPVTDLDLINGQLSQHFTLGVPVNTEVFNLQLLLSEELLDLQIQTLTSNSEYGGKKELIAQTNEDLINT